MAVSSPASLNLLDRTFDACRFSLRPLFFFGAVVNLLALTTSLYMMQLFDRVIVGRSWDTLLFLTLMAGVAILALAALDAVRGRMLSRVGSFFEQALGPAAFERGIAAALRGYPYRGEALRDIAQVRSLVASPSILAVFDAPWVPLFVGVIAILNPVVGGIAVAGGLALFVLAFINERYTRRPLKRSTQRAMVAMRRVDAAHRNAEVVDALGMADDLIERWLHDSRAVIADQQRASDRAALMLSIIKFARLGLQLLVLAVGAWQVVHQELTAGAMIASSILISRALSPLENAVATWKQVMVARDALGRLRSFFMEPARRQETMLLPAPIGRLDIDNISYMLPGSDKPVLRNIRFALQPATSLAIVGPSGAGKSTLARLIVGILKPAYGTVRLDSIELYGANRDQIGPHLGYLPQDVELFDGTVKDNISRMAEGSPEAVIAAARLAGVHDLILRLPQGYECELGEGGSKLSAGQRQRVALARAVYGSPRLVVLDEPNSNLDAEGEAALVQAMQALKNDGATIVLITHRPNLLSAVDKVLVLREGAMHRFGDRDEVLSEIMPQRPAPRPVELHGARLAAVETKRATP
jgi:PrtD family type I secretion system ABC transporter